RADREGFLRAANFGGRCRSDGDAGRGCAEDLLRGGKAVSKSTPAQRFAKFHALWIDKGATKGDRDSAKHQMANWLKHHEKTLDDIPEILDQARADDAVADAPSPPPPPDPRAGTSHPYGGRRFSPADVVEHVIRRYVWMPEHVAVISTLWTCFTHVYQRFAI